MAASYKVFKGVLHCIKGDIYIPFIVSNIALMVRAIILKASFTTLSPTRVLECHKIALVASCGLHEAEWQGSPIGASYDLNYETL